MNSKNCPVPNVWVFIAQLLEPSSTNAEVTGTNPDEDNNFNNYSLSPNGLFVNSP